MHVLTNRRALTVLIVLGALLALGVPVLLTRVLEPHVTSTPPAQERATRPAPAGHAHG
jgi:hypothetical protein